MVDENYQRADVIISGGGLAGLALALLLGGAGVRVALIEPHPPAPVAQTKVTGRTVALMQSSLAVLRAAGMGDFCAAYGTKMEVMRIIDDSMAGEKIIRSEFDSFDLGLPYFSMNLPNGMLRAAMYEKAKAAQNITVFQSALADYKAEAKVIARLEDGTRIAAPLIIGADGRNSKVREIAGIKASKKDYGQSAITCVINHSCAHNNSSTEFHRSGGPFALVPMQGNQSSVVWVERTQRAQEFMSLPRDAFEQAIAERTNHILGAVTLETTPECWPLCTIKTTSMTAQRVALIAEAAHVMSPITAQGLNLSLRDVAALAENIMDAMRLGMDLGSKETLRAYEKRRSWDVRTRVLGVNGMNQIVSTERNALKDLRRMGLKIVDGNSILKMIAMQHGLAPSLDQGRIIRGETL